jgi:hypothetical protein
MPRKNLRRAHPIVRTYCERRGGAYSETGLLESLREIVDHFRGVSRIGDVSVLNRDRPPARRAREKIGAIPCTAPYGLRVGDCAMKQGDRGRVSGLRGYGQPHAFSAMRSTRASFLRAEVVTCGTAWRHLTWRLVVQTSRVPPRLSQRRCVALASRRT